MANPAAGIGKGLSMVAGVAVAFVFGALGVLFLFTGVIYLLQGYIMGLVLGGGIAAACFAIPAGLWWLGQR